MARVYIYNLIKNYLNYLFYWDTDGIFMNKEMFLSSNELGKFRLVSINEQAYFIATKFYYYKQVDHGYHYTFRGITTANYVIELI